MANAEEEPKVQMVTYPSRTQRERLKELSRRTRIPQAVLVREALDLLFQKHTDDLTTPE